MFFAANATAAFAAISAAVPVGADENVVIADASHEANREPWLAFRNVRTWPCDVNGSLDLEKLPVDASTKVVAIPAASNASGAVYDVAAVVKACKQRAPRAFVVVDGVAFAPHRPPALGDADAHADPSGPDFYERSFKRRARRRREKMKRWWRRPRREDDDS